jgi:large subunit ribosomal protein L5
MSELAKKYQEEVVPELMDKLGFDNPWAVPRLVKVVVNIGLGEAIDDSKIIKNVSSALVSITGQQPKVTRARQAISGFKLRKGAPIGLMVTLRGKRMHFFLERLFRIVLPRLRDFQGVPLKSFDGRGNYTLGLPEQTVFPEVDYEKIDKVRGLEVTIVTTANSDKQAKALLSSLGMPFEKVKAEDKKPNLSD